MSSEPLLLTRFEAGVDTGLGHAMRQLALLQAWRDAGGAGLAVVSGAPDAVAARYRAEGVEVAAAPAGEPAALLALARDRGAAVVCFDGYGLGDALADALRAGGLPVARVDDFGTTGAPCADLILDQNPGATAAPYGEGPRLLLGPRYALLRRELRAGRRAPMPATGGRLLVLMGGSDPGGVTGRVLEAVAERVRAGLELRVVVGAANPRAEAVRAGVEELGPGAAVAQAVEDMSTLYEWADAAVSGAGSTCLELCRFQVPFAAVVLAANQVPMEAYLAEHGAAHGLGSADGGLGERLPAALAAVLDSAEARASQRRAQGDLVDGQGAARVAAALRELAG